MALDLAVANEILKHVYGHADDCPCQRPREQAELKARLLSKYGLTEQRPHTYDATKYLPVLRRPWIEMLMPNTPMARLRHVA